MNCYIFVLDSVFSKEGFIAGDSVTVSEDEEYKKANFDKFATLKPVFQKEGGKCNFKEKYVDCG